MRRGRPRPSAPDHGKPDPTAPTHQRGIPATRDVAHRPPLTQPPFARFHDPGISARILRPEYRDHGPDDASGLSGTETRPGTSASAKQVQRPEPLRVLQRQAGPPSPSGPIPPGPQPPPGTR